ncbi:H/ACA ribonucleoprotein complex subunit gar1-like [Penaeus chinensis]|uniref:H/ACA ribonucleoprotein complex subunit gar1-like n=1 Tax=Penaeus chinensis TaxID=139456 RepID=UPI001FB5DD7A|nr:H/ACA ribonucleoprotein complex subunit gar1-like [Penaeus chinensis]
MKLLAITLLITAALAKPQGYSLPSQSENGFSSGFTSGPEIQGGNDFTSGIIGASSHESSSGAGYNGDSGGPSGACRDGEILHVDGSCVVPKITRTIYVFRAPDEPQQPVGPPPSVPPPRVEENIVFVHVPEAGPAPDPIILPPPRQEQIVYILNKNDGGGGQRVIEVTAPPPSDPEVYFVNYQEGENPTLPIGVDLETALSVVANGGGQAIGGAAGLGADGFGDVGFGDTGFGDSAVGTFGDVIFGESGAGGFGGDLRFGGSGGGGFGGEGGLDESGISSLGGNGGFGNNGDEGR